MKIEAFLAHVEQDLIPPEAPDHLTLHGVGNIGQRHAYWTARECCTKRGMWAIVDLQWVRCLSTWLDGRSVLEIMAGRGWLAKALQDQGITVTPTDNGGWTGRHSNLAPITTILFMDAVKAVEALGDVHDVLLISWPPYGEDTICRAVEAWGPDKPIIYIGEGEGGCNAPDEFWENFQENGAMPDFPLYSWDNIHDHVFIGWYSRKEHDKCCSSS